MSPAEAVERSARPDLLTAGMVIWLGSEVMFFGGMFAAYFTLRGGSEDWAGPDVHLATGLAALFTGVLVASSLTMHRAARAGARNDLSGVVRWTGITILLGTLFLGNQVYEWWSLDFTIASHTYGSLFYLMTGFHGLHVLGGVAAMALMVSFLRRAGRVHHGAVEAITWYWHFVDVVWVILFAVLFFVR